MIKKISEYGYNFQIKLLVGFLTDSTFIEQIHDILDDRYFESDSIRWITRQCKEYFLEYRMPITMDVFKVKMKEVENDILKTTVKSDLKEVYKNLEATDLEYVKDQSVNFFRNQALKNAIVQSVEILESSGDFDEIKKLIDEASRAGIKRDLGHEYFDMIEARYEQMSRDTIETPWAVINDLTQGGLGAGELGVVTSPAGGGKSWILSSIGAAALKNGNNVIHYSLELNESYCGLRYDSIFSGIANQNLKYHKEDVKERLGELKEKKAGQLTIKEFPTKTATIQTLMAHVQRMKSMGESVDFMVVDYADILKDQNKFTKEVRHALGNIYEDLRGLAGELKIPIWTASQSGRAALEDDVIEAGRISESYQKIMIADFVLSLSRKIEDKVAHTGRFHVIKNRFGPDGLTFPAKVDTNTGTIDIYESNTVGGQELQNKMNNRDKITKKILSDKYNILMD